MQQASLLLLLTILVQCCGFSSHAFPAKPVVIPPLNPKDPLTLADGTRKTVLIVGGGLSGLSAAMELVERGYDVTIKEADSVIGGKLYARKQVVEHTKAPLVPGTTFDVEHGFHAWFSNYHQFKDIRNRLGINGNFRPWEKVDYVFKKYKNESVYSEGPYPLNLLGILQRSPNMKLTDAVRLTLAAPDLVWFNYDTVYEQYDDISFYEWADRKKIDRTFFEIMMEPAMSVTLNDPNVISAATMLVLMQLYFLSDPEADRREVLKVPFNRGVLFPWAKHLMSRGAKIFVSSPVQGLYLENGRVVGEIVGMGNTTTGGAGGGVESHRVERYDHTIMAVDLPGMRSILAGSVVADDFAKSSLEVMSGRFSMLGLAPPYKVMRVWFDGPLNEGRPDILETPQHRPINLIARYDRLEDEFMDWAKANNGSVIEFHLYTWKAEWKEATDSLQVWALIKDVVYSIYPELSAYQAIGFTLQQHENFCSYAKSQERIRPVSEWPASIGFKNMYLAGDYVRTRYPSALMERAVSTGREAANHVLFNDGVRQATMVVAPSRGPGLL